MKKLLFFLFAALIFFVPLVLWPFTSEVFEFNKIVLTYTLTILIVAVWSVKSILERKIIFRPTVLDARLLIFLATQIISTIISLDPQTSFFGYYSRFNGGLLSILCYCLLYWAFVSNFDSKDTSKIIKVWLGSAFLVSVYAILEHFGVDKDVWVQDVQNRVFSTLGQPNWLAAFIVALIPLTWRGSKTNYFLSVLFFIVLLFTKSRSGLLGFGIAYFIFWTLNFLKMKKDKETLKPFIVISSSLLAVSLILGTQFTPSISSFLNNKKENTQIAPTGPALETGGTESGTIRKIVWKGAINIWQHYPILGTGVETFAFAYQQFRPTEHNLVSEWDFIYNKAHNEYLNFLATTGVLGLISYLTLIGFSIFQILKTNSKLTIGILAGYISLLVTNFFGFSVVATQLQLFLFPAIALGLMNNDQLLSAKKKNEKTQTNQKIGISTVLIIASYLILIIVRYWYADIFYTKGKAYNSINKPDVALDHLTSALNFQPNQPLYHSEIATSYVNLALLANKEKNATETARLTALALEESQKAIDLSSNNPNLKRSRFGIFIMLSSINSNFLISARDTLISAINYAPTDAKLYYNLGLTYARTGDMENGIATLKKAVELKPNYKEARLGYALLLINKGEKIESKNQLEYILKFIDPNDSFTKQTLESVK